MALPKINPFFEPKVYGSCSSSRIPGPVKCSCPSYWKRSDKVCAVLPHTMRFCKKHRCYVCTTCGLK